MTQDDETDAWAHIEAERFADAEKSVRTQIAGSDPNDHQEQAHLHGLLGSILNSLERHSEAMDVLLCALEQARLFGRPTTVDIHRYMLANQYLQFGQPEDALAAAQPLPTGSGHAKCLLHAVTAEALWRLARHDDARRSVENALAAAPTAERRADLASALEYILNSSC